MSEPNSNEGVPCANGLHVWFSDVARGKLCKCGQARWEPSESELARLGERLAVLEKRVNEIEPHARRAR